MASNTDVIDGLGFGRKWFEHLMQRALKTNMTLASVQGRKLDGGYLSVIASMQMSWNIDVNSKIQLPENIVIKIPNIMKINAIVTDMHTGGNDEYKIEDIMGDDVLAWSHRTECLSYELFNANGHRPPVPMAKYFYSEMRHGENEGVLIIEDLSGIAAMPKIEEGLTVSQLRSLMKALASLHAFGLKHPDWNAAGHFAFAKERMKGFEEMLRKGGESLRELPEAKGIFCVTDEQLDRLCDLKEVMEIIERHQSVIVHGDLWGNNIFYRLDEKGGLSDELAAIFDWQITHPGPPCEDLMRIMSSSVSEKIRREREFELIDEYYAYLEELMGGSCVPIPFTVEDVKRLYRRTFKLGACIMLMGVPVLVSSGGYSLENKIALIRRVQAGVEDALKFM